MRVVGEGGIEKVSPERVQKMGDQARPWFLLESDNILALADSFI